MSPANGLLYTDQRVLLALSQLVNNGRDQSVQPITQAEISQKALVSPRTVQMCIPRLVQAGLLETIDGRRGVSPVYVITERGYVTLEG